MNLFIIPSWYPSTAFPSTGIFFREQAELIAKYRPEWNIGLSLWGSHEPDLWVKSSQPMSALFKLTSRFPVKQADRVLDSGAVEFFTPAHTWTRRIFRGNIQKIITANYKNLQRFMEAFGRPDVIIAQVAHPGGYIAQHISGREKIPYIIIEHMVPFPMPAYRRDYHRLLIPPLQHAQRVYGVSHDLVKRLRSHNIPADKSSNFIDDRFFSPAESEPEIYTYLSVGRLVEQKGYDLLLEAIQRMQKPDVSFKFNIAGSGPLKKTLMQQCHRLGLDHQVNWLGELDRTQLIEQLHQSNCLVLASRYENQPVSILEALACGLPVVTTDTGASEMISKKNGLVVESGNIAQLAEALNRISNNSYSKVMIRKDFEEKYGTAKIITKFEAELKELLKTFSQC